MVASTVKSQALTDADVQPILDRTAGEGAASDLKVIDDFVAVDAVGIADTGSTYTLLRFPTSAKVKRLEVLTDGPIDSNATQQLAIDFNIAFSDSKYDGTQTALQAQAPAAAADGTTVVKTSANRNKLFGTITLSGNNKAIDLQEITFGILSAHTPEGDTAAHQAVTGGTLAFADTQKPLWKKYGFVNGRGDPQDPGGNFDLYVKVATAAATGAAANLYAKLEYV
jgi:hypothetical protein